MKIGKGNSFERFELISAVAGSIPATKHMGTLNSLKKSVQIPANTPFRFSE